MFAPLTMICGALSPPMASRAMVRRPVKFKPWVASLGLAATRAAATWFRSNGFDFDYLAAVVVTAGVAYMVRALQLTAVRALVVRARLERMVRPSHVAPGLRDLLFWNRHTLSPFNTARRPRRPFLSQNRHLQQARHMGRRSSTGSRNARQASLIALQPLQHRKRALRAAFAAPLGPLQPHACGARVGIHGEAQLLGHHLPEIDPARADRLG